tara:strand:+ start:7148 stop:8170 length:1023 start_codon:yes stop_codon:yes gene_type:complete
MCGIGGYYNVSGGDTPLSDIRSLWEGLETRGTHAAGLCVGWMGADGPIVKKAAKTASKCSEMLSLAQGNNTQYVLLHTRFTTQGSVKNNGNNHPVVGHGITLIHNGVLSNDSNIFKRLNINPLHDVDTEAINAALSAKSPKWMVENISGSMSIAWVDTQKSPDAVHLLTNGKNPLVIGRTSSGDIVWASTKTHLEQSGFCFKDGSMWDAIPFKQYTILKGGRIVSKMISKKRSIPSNSRALHSSQYTPTYDTTFWGDVHDWEDEYDNVAPKYKKKSKKQPSKEHKEYAGNSVVLTNTQLKLITGFMYDNGYDLVYSKYGVGSFNLDEEYMYDDYTKTELV